MVTRYVMSGFNGSRWLFLSLPRRTNKKLFLWKEIKKARSVGVSLRKECLDLFFYYYTPFF